MPRRIIIKDGGLTSSVSAPSGFTILGSDSGEIKKQVDTTISSLGGGGSLGYKVYSALLTQTGTSAPTSEILQNTLGLTPSFSYYNTGIYSINATSTFILSKTAVFGQNPTNGTINFDTVFDAPNKIYIYSRSSVGGGGVNGLFSKNYIEIRVYD